MYVRLYPSLGNNHIPKTKYFVEGKEVTKEIFLSHLTPSEQKKQTGERPECFTIKADNILGIPENVEKE